MDTTFPCSATKSSSCSRREGVMWALTWAVRFSLVIGRNAPGSQGRKTAGGTAPRHEENARRNDAARGVNFS